MENKKQPNMLNILALRNNLRETGWCITAFSFVYNKTSYTVLFEDLDKTKEKNKFYIARITFIDDNEDRRISVLANTYSFDISISQLRKFFKIKYIKNLGDLFQQFYVNFNKFIPKQFVTPTPTQKDHIIKQLNSNDNDNSLYCYKVQRNGKRDGIQSHRTIFNDNKTRLLRPILYEFFKNDNTISFCYSPKKSDEKTDNEIIRNSKNH